MSDVLFENEGWDKDASRMAELARAVLNGSRWNEAPELAALALRAVNELGRLRRERDEAEKRAADAILDPCDRCGHCVSGRLRLALSPLPSETVADAAERVAKERLAYEQAAETAEERAAKLVRERDEALERADAAEADAKLWRGATATLPLTPDALGKVLFEADGQCSWKDDSAFEDACKDDAVAVARAVMAALSSDAAANAAWDGSWGKPSGWWTGLLEAAAKAALALPEQDTPPQQAEAPKLEWSPGFPLPGDYEGRYALDLRRNIEALDARLRKLEGSR